MKKKRRLDLKAAGVPTLHAPSMQKEDECGEWDFFISHTQRNPEGKLMAEALYNTLEGEGFRCWLDVKMDDMNMAAMEAGVRGSNCVLAVVTGPCSNVDYPDVAESDNAYFGRWMCCKELLWAVDAGVPVIPIIRAPRTRRKSASSAQAPSDLKVHESCSALKAALEKIDFIHVDRSTNEDSEFCGARLSSGIGQ